MGPPGDLGDGEVAGGHRPRTRPSLHGCADDTEGWSHRRDVGTGDCALLGAGRRLPLPNNQRRRLAGRAVQAEGTV